MNLTSRHFANVLSPLVLAAILMMSLSGFAAAQSQTGTQQTTEDVERAKADAEAEQRRRDEAAQSGTDKSSTSPQDEARKPKRDKHQDARQPERELEEEEDI